jgi:hypothetical protein
MADELGRMLERTATRAAAFLSAEAVLRAVS